MKKIIIFIVMTLLPMLSFAVEVKINGLWYNLVSKNKQAELIRYKGTRYSGNIKIPATVEYGEATYSVTSIGDYAFSDCSGLTSITIPNSVTGIGDWTFNDCSGLTSVHISDLEAWCKITFTYEASNPLNYAHHLYLNGIEIKDLVIPNSVISIGSYAFSGCSSLTSVTIPNSVTSIGEYAFSECNGLTSVHISDLEAWCKIVFGGLSNPCSKARHLFLNGVEIKDLVIPNSVTYIGSYAFPGCSSLNSITIPNSVTSIGEQAFVGCNGLTSVTIPSSVTSIGEYAFAECNGLTSVTIPSSVTSISWGVFYCCTSLTSVTIPNSVTSIGNNAFYGCSGLTSVTIPNSVTYLGGSAFYGCSGLTSVIIGSGVMEIGKTYNDRTFANCQELTDVYCYAENVPSTESNAFEGSYIEYATLHVPAESIELYKAKSPWNGFGDFVVIGEEMPQETIEIASGHEFIDFANRVNAGETLLCAKLTADIDLSSVSNKFVTIGREYNPYRGTFDGQNHKIAGFRMDEAIGNRQGLFGNITGALIQNFSIDGDITYYGGTGVGVIGWSEGSTIRNVHSSLRITINSNDSHHIGGICGSLRTGTKAIGCSFCGIIIDSANNYDCIGGIGGYSNDNCLYENCANYGTIFFTATNTYAGGICGYVNNNSFSGVKNCLNTGTIGMTNGATPDYGGAMVGRLRKHSNSVFENNYMLNGSAVCAGGENDIASVNKVNAIQLKDGEICYKLNGDQTVINWYQTLYANEDQLPDPYPVLISTHEIVLYNDACGYYNANNPDGIKSLTPALSTGEGDWYDLNGRKLDKPQKGINIIRYSDGTSKKVLVR